MNNLVPAVRMAGALGFARIISLTVLPKRLDTASQVSIVLAMCTYNSKARQISICACYPDTTFSAWQPAPQAGPLACKDFSAPPRPLPTTHLARQTSGELRETGAQNRLQLALGSTEWVPAQVLRMGSWVAACLPATADDARSGHNKTDHRDSLSSAGGTKRCSLLKQLPGRHPPALYLEVGEPSWPVAGARSASNTSYNGIGGALEHPFNSCLRPHTEKGVDGPHSIEGYLGEPAALVHCNVSLIDAEVKTSCQHVFCTCMLVFAMHHKILALPHVHLYRQPSC